MGRYGGRVPPRRSPPRPSCSDLGSLGLGRSRPRAGLVSARPRPVAPREYRILLYGHPGSGKSSFIEHALGLDRVIVSTADFSIYHGRLPLSLRRAATGGPGGGVILTEGVDLIFADYCGQDPGQLIVDPDPQFFGESGRRQVDAILFLVDFFPAYKDEKTDRVYDDEEVLREVSTSAESAVRKRQ